MHRHLLSLSARRYSVVLFSGALLTILCVISVAQMVYQVRYDTDYMVVSDIGTLVSALKNIDEVCSIAGFDQDAVTLDFLTVKSPMAQHPDQIQQWNKLHQYFSV